MPRAASAALAAGVAALALPATAAAHGQPVPVSGLPGAWRLDPVVLGLAAVAAILFAQAFIRLRRRGRTDHAPWTRAVLFAVALALAVLPLVSPLDAIGDQYLMSAHMLQHVLIGDAALAVALLSLRGPLGLFLLPPFVLRPLGHSGAVRAAVGFLLRPSVAVAAWALAMGLWHIPAIYDYALGHPGAHKLEHLSFVVAGTLVWAQLIDPARRGRLGLVQRIGFAGLLFALGTVLSDVLIFSFHPLYPAYADQSVRLWGISALRDQQLAGLVMMGEQLLVLGLCAALLLRALARRRVARVPRAAQART